jgi:hypothetical protein
VSRTDNKRNATPWNRLEIVRAQSGAALDAGATDRVDAPGFSALVKLRRRRLRQMSVLGSSLPNGDRLAEAQIGAATKSPVEWANSLVHWIAASNTQSMGNSSYPRVRCVSRDWSRVSV